MAFPVINPFFQFFDDAGDPLSSGTVETYEENSITPKVTYQNADLSTPNDTVIELDGAGRCSMFVDDGEVFKYIVKDADGNVIKTEDGVRSPIGTSDGIIDAIEEGGDDAADELLNLIDRQQADHYGANTTPGTTDRAATLQAAIDAATDSSAEIRVHDDNTLSKPLLIREGSASNITFVGNGRVVTIFRPLTADISVLAQGINALFINQKNNGHVHFRHIRFLDASAFTGNFWFSTEGGATDGLCDASFSMVIDDCWFSPSSNNSGIFRGGFSNLMVTNTVFESTKTGCFRLDGAGNGDQFYVGNVMNFCYDSFIYAVDSALKANITVQTLHVYQHLRGPVIEMVNAIDVKFDNIHMQPDANQVLPASTGLLKLTDCWNVQAHNLTLLSRTDVPKGECAVEIIGTKGAGVDSSRGVFTNIVSDARIGLRLSGTGVVDLVFANCDFTGCENAYQFLSGSLEGIIRFYNCKFNNSLKYGFLHSSGSPALKIYGYNCEIINAGLDGSTTARNIDLSTTSGGEIIFYDTMIGRTTPAATATHFIRNESLGTVQFVRPRFVGSPPTGIITGASYTDVVYEHGYGGVIASAATITLPAYGDVFEISGTTNITSVTSTNCKGRRATLVFQSTPTFTDGSNLLLSANLVATANDTITIVCHDGSNWVETGRSVN